MTERDTLVMLLEEFGSPLPDPAPAPAKPAPALSAGSVEPTPAGADSFREVMEREMASLRLPLEDAVDWLLEHARVRPGFHELAREHRPLIVSSSFEETIRPILRREGIELEVVANRVDARADGLEGTQLEYKYTLGDWEHVEKDGACGEIGNRLLTLSYGPGGAHAVADAVENWRNVAPCGN